MVILEAVHTRFTAGERGCLVSGKTAVERVLGSVQPIQIASLFGAHLPDRVK